MEYKDPGDIFLLYSTLNPKPLNPEPLNPKPQTLSLRCEEMIARWHSGESSHPDREILAAECASSMYSPP